jgi:protease PrsW
VLRSSARRSAARRHAGLVAGAGARSAVRRLQRAQARLAVELSRGASVSRCCDDVRSHRRTLIGLGHPEALDGGSSSWRHASTAGPALLAIAVLWAALTALGGS